MINVDKITKKMCKIIKNAGKRYIDHAFFEMNEKYKFENDDVTNLDVQTQEYIKTYCLKIIPGSNFIGEEGGVNQNSKYTWILDPIDGTYNFKHKIDIFGTQLCLLEDNAPILSVLYLPSLDELYYANEGGAYKNGKRIHVSEQCDFKQAVVGFGDYSTKYDISLQQQISKVLSTTMKRVRMFGSSCFDSCKIASGSIDVYIIFSTNKWDLIPGQYLIMQAGGYIWKNQVGDTYISGNKENVEKLVEILKFNTSLN